MKATNRAKSLGTVVAFKSLQIQIVEDSKRSKTAQLTFDREPDSSRKARTMIVREKSLEAFDPASHDFSTMAHVVMLPVLVAAHEDLSDTEGGSSVQMDSGSGFDQGGITTPVSSEEDSNGPHSERSRYVYGSLILDRSRHEVVVQGREIVLTRKEFDLLECLLKYPGHVRPREVLLNAVWGYDYYGTTRTIDVHIRRLKQKIPMLNRAIVSVRGLGYKLTDRAINVGTDPWCCACGDLKD